MAQARATWEPPADVDLVLEATVPVAENSVRLRSEIVRFG